NSDPILRQIPQYTHPIDLRTAHRNHRHRPPPLHPNQKPARVTSQSGPMVTSLSGVYNASAHNHELWNVELVALAPQVRLSRWGTVGPSGSNGDHQTRTRHATIL